MLGLRSQGTQIFQPLSILSKLPKPTFLSSLSSPSITEKSPSLTPEPKNLATRIQLTEQEVTKINLLIPRLCLTDNLNTATSLTITALTTNPPPKSISFSVLIHSLTSQPDLALPISLLSKLKQSREANSHLTSITTLIISSYLRKGRPKEALMVYDWMLRSGSKCSVEKKVFGILVDGFCNCGLVFEALRVLRDMLGMNLAVKDSLRKRVFRSLLREARIGEAKELDEALGMVGSGEDEGVKKVLALLDQMISNWTE